MNVTFYSNFQKRKNSTLRPTAAGTTLNVRLKDNCRILSPVFLVEGQHFNYNYCLWNGRYYFVVEAVIIANNLFEVQCRNDVLATYRPQIGEYNAFIERAATGYDTLVSDIYLTASNNINNMKETTINMPTASTDLYVVPICGRNGVIQYVFNSLSQASVFFSTGQSMTFDGESITPAQWRAVLKDIGFAFVGGDATNYMGDMYYTPYIAPVIPAYITTNDLVYGWYSISQASQLNVLNPNGYHYWFTADLTDPGNTYSDFRAYDNTFSEYKIYLPGCGIYNLDAADCGKKDLKIEIMLDFLTTTVSYKIYHTNGTQVALFEGKFGCPVPAMSSRMDVFGILQDSFKIAGQGMGKDYTGAATTMIDAVHKSVSAQPTGSSAGIGNATVLKQFPNIIYSVKNYTSKDFPTTCAGRPVYSNAAISTRSGFVKCGNASISIPGYDNEKDELNSYLNTGFYYE